MQNSRNRQSRTVAFAYRLVSASLFGLYCLPGFGQSNTVDPANRVLEEVIVVAQKREQDLQTIPLGVSVLDTETIRQSGMLDLKKLTELHPSVSFDTAQSFQRSSLKIRGVGTIGNTRSFEGAVGVFIDGVSRPRNGMALADLLDINSIEILRGPQGTLFGKNTVAGALSIRTTPPDPDVTGGDVELRLGNFDARYVSGVFNMPIGDSTTFRIAGSLNERDGSFVSPDNGDTYNDTDRYGIKAQLLFQPNDNLDLNLIIDHSKADANCCWSSAVSESGPTAPLIDFYSSLNGLTFSQPPEAERNRSESLNTSPREIVEDSGLTTTLNWDLQGLTLRSITSVRDWKHNQVNGDADFVPADLFTLNEPANIETASQEISFSIPFGESNDLLIGLLLATEDYDSTRFVQTGSDADNYLNALISAAQGAVACLPPVVTLDCLFPIGIAALLDDGDFSAERYFQDSQSLDVFAHVTIDLAEKFTLVTGLRYSEEDKDGGVDNLYWYDSAIARATMALAGVPDDGTPRNGLDVSGTVYSPSFVDSTRSREVTSTLSLQYFASEQIMIYGGYHRGYKAGGINLYREGVAANQTTYRPEFAESIEAGIKSTYWRNRARTNVAFFHTEFSDLQINFFTGLEFRTENTGRVTTQGVEIENIFQFTDYLSMEVAATYLDSAFKTIESPFLSYLAGRDTPRAPDWAGVLTLNYEKPLTSKLNFVARSMNSYVGSHYVGADVPVEQKVGSYLINDLSVGITHREKGWDLLLWCNNCRDVDYRTIYFNTTFQPGTYSSFLNDPRQYGLTFRSRF